MSIYEYSCSECRIVWERDFPFAKPEKKTPCPECEAECGQHYHGRDVPVHFKGEGWTGKNKLQGFYKQGGSDEVNLELQKRTKEAISEGWQAYSKYTPSEGYLKEMGARRKTDKEVTETLDAARQFSQHSYDKAGIDPYNKYKPQ